MNHYLFGSEDVREHYFPDARISCALFQESKAHFSLMEEWGSGYHRIMTACTEGGYPLPEWEEIGPVLRVTFVPHPQTTTLPVHQAKEGVPVNVPVNERQQWFLEQLGQSIPCGPADIAAKWDVALKTAKRDIADLRKKDLIIFVGPPKTGSYTLK